VGDTSAPDTPTEHYYAAPSSRPKYNRYPPGAYCSDYGIDSTASDVDDDEITEVHSSAGEGSSSEVSQAYDSSGDCYDGDQDDGYSDEDDCDDLGYNDDDYYADYFD